MATTKKTARSAAPKTLTISAEQFMAGLKRFGSVCDYVEREMSKGQVDERALDQVRQQQATQPPKPSPSAEQMAAEMRSLAQDVAEQAGAIRTRLMCGGSVPGQGTDVNNALAPTQGPLKDYVDGTTHFLFSIRRDLDAINQYTNG